MKGEKINILKLDLRVKEDGEGQDRNGISIQKSNGQRDRITNIYQNGTEQRAVQEVDKWSEKEEIKLYS